MCLLSYFPPGVMPVREHLEEGARLNPAGFGYGASLQDDLIWNRFLDPEKAISEFLALRGFLPETPAFFHSRLATVGQASLELAHPFPVGDEMIMAHNGYLFPVEEGRSDSLVFAEEVLPHYDLSDPGQFRALEEMMGRNKAVVLTPDRTYILNKSLGIELDDGTWHSNEDFTGVTHMIEGLCVACHLDEPMEGISPELCDDCHTSAGSRRELMMAGAR